MYSNIDVCSKDFIATKTKLLINLVRFEVENWAMVDDTLNAYEELLTVYNTEIGKLRKQLDKEKHMDGDPVQMINSRMAINDSYLNLPSYPPNYIKIKHHVQPLLVTFLAYNNLLNEEQKAEYNQRKSQIGDYGGLEALIGKFSPFRDFIAAEIRNQKLRQDTLRSPIRPTNKNAKQKWHQYEHDKQKFDNDCDVIAGNIKEFESLLEHYNELQKDRLEKNK